MLYKEPTFYRAYKGGVQMRRKGSDIAKEIIASWKREENGKEKAERNRLYWINKKNEKVEKQRSKI